MHKNNQLRLWWIPQVPMKAFYVNVETVEEAEKIWNVLADYDLFQYENKVKGDYCNTGGLEIYMAEEDEWFEWEAMEGEFEGMDINEIIHEKRCASE